MIDLIHIKVNRKDLVPFSGCHQISQVWGPLSVAPPPAVLVMFHLLALWEMPVVEERGEEIIRNTTTHVNLISFMGEMNHNSQVIFTCVLPCQRGIVHRHPVQRLSAAPWWHWAASCHLSASPALPPAAAVPSPYNPPQ